MIELKNKAKCCGCTACKSICPKKCITMQEDDEGFLYPVIDKGKCVKCGICIKVCPFLKPFLPQVPIEVYAAKNKDTKIRKTSSSGGIFMALAEKVISLGGVVFGARFDNEWNVYHDYQESIEGIKSFQGSKYVQSDLRECYGQAKIFLEVGRLVLFTGTPCQIAGLKHFLRKDYENLLTADIICHGTPSPLVWRNYLKEIKRDSLRGINTVSLSPIHSSEREGFIDDYETNIDTISFRDKRTGWKKYSFSLNLTETTAKGKKNTVSLSCIHTENTYLKGFLKNYYIRPSCHNCTARMGKSNADYTLADFWKVEKFFQDDNIGTSLLLINSLRGKAFLPHDKLYCEKSSIDVIWDSNSPYFQSPIRTYKRKQFWRYYRSNLPLSDIILRLEPTWIDSILLRFSYYYYRLCLKIKIKKSKKYGL